MVMARTRVAATSSTATMMTMMMMWALTIASFVPARVTDSNSSCCVARAFSQVAVARATTRRRRTHAPSSSGAAGWRRICSDSDCDDTSDSSPPKTKSLVSHLPTRETRLNMVNGNRQEQDGDYNAHKNNDDNADSDEQQHHILLSAALEGILEGDGDNDNNNNNIGDYHDDYHDMDEYNEADENRFRYSQWKSKCYLMLKDVHQLIQRKSQKAIPKAQAVVERILEEQPTSRLLLQAYNLWLQAISKTCPDSDKGRQAEAILHQMKESTLVNPTVISYTICIMAHCNSPLDAERLLFELLERQTLSGTSALASPLAITSSITTDAVLQAWAQQGTLEAAERARLILERLEQFAASSSLDTFPRANSHTYAIVMNAYSQLGQVEQVEAMLTRLREKQGKLVDTVVYNVAIKAWANSQDARAGSRAAKLLQEMQQLDGLSPDIITYNSVISAWSKCGHVNAAPQAERVLQEMIEASKKEKSSTAPRPNVVSYNTVLHAWSKSPHPNAVSRASAILQYMIANDATAPDLYSFTSVLNAVAKSKAPTKAVQARKLLDTLLQLSNKGIVTIPKDNNIAFNIVLNTCAFSASFDEETKMEALQIAIATFAQLRSPTATASRPDEVTYGILLKAIGNLVSGKDRAKRQQLALTVARQCMEDGLVGEMVWDQLPRLISVNRLSSLLPRALRDRQAVALIDLPRQWRRNVVSAAKMPLKQRRRRQQQEKQEESSVSSKPNEKRQQRAVEKATAPPLIRKPRGITESSWASGKDL